MQARMRERRLWSPLNPKVLTSKGNHVASQINGSNLSLEDEHAEPNQQPVLHRIHPSHIPRNRGMTFRSWHRMQSSGYKMLSLAMYHNLRFCESQSRKVRMLALITPATFMVRAEVRPMSMKTLMFRANAAPAFVRKMKGLKSTLASFITGLSSSCTGAQFAWRDFVVEYFTFLF